MNLCKVKNILTVDRRSSKFINKRLCVFFKGLWELLIWFQIIPRDLKPCSNSIFNSAVVPDKEGFGCCWRHNEITWFAFRAVIIETIDLGTFAVG